MWCLAVEDCVGKTGKDGVIDLVLPVTPQQAWIWTQHSFKNMAQLQKLQKSKAHSSLHKCEFIYKSGPNKYTLNKQNGKYTQAVMHTKCIATSNSSCRYRKANDFFFQTHINNVALFCLLLCNTATIQLPAILHKSGSKCVLPVSH